MPGLTSTISATTPQGQSALLEDLLQDLERPWVVLLWDDPVNEMSYVSRTLRKVLKISAQQAEALMLDVHTRGKAAVDSGTREHAEATVTQLHANGLQATFQQD